MAVKLVCGCGYLGKRIADRWLAAGHEVWATTRRAERATSWIQSGIKPIITDLTGPFRLPSELLNIDTVLFAVGFDRRSNHSIQEVYAGGAEKLLQALQPRTPRFIYISSTGVYGESDGEWVDETTECHPTRPGGVASLAAERLLAEHPIGGRRIILRLAGIYGPDRIPKLADVRKGLPLALSPQGYLNLIHVEDAAEIVLRAEQVASLPALYNVSDGHPVLRGDFYRELAKLVSAPTPNFNAPASDSSTVTRASGDKRVSSRRLQEDLHVPLKFPTYREGLAQIVAGIES